jgi:hypothetical protein
MRPVKIEPNNKPVKTTPRKGNTLCQVFDEEKWPAPVGVGEPWPKPENEIKHQGGTACPCKTCAKPVQLAAPGIPMPDTTSPTWPHVFAFACAMEAKLARNRRKGDAAGWRADGTERLQPRLDDEVEELNHALSDYYSAHRQERDPKLRTAVLLEAADVANFAMMIADCVTHE